MMAKGTGRDATPESSPQSFPESSPVFQGTRYDFALQTVFDLQKSVGSLTHAVESLEKTVEKHDTKIDNLSHRMYAAGIIIALLSPIVLLGLDKLLSWILQAIKH